MRIARGAPRKVAKSASPSVTVILFAFAAALALSSCSAYCSVVGLTTLFPGAFGVAIAIGCALEATKLAAVGVLGQRHGGVALRAVLVTLVATLMAINAVSVFGLLSAGHINQQVAGEAVTDAQAAKADAAVTAPQHGGWAPFFNKVNVDARTGEVQVARSLDKCWTQTRRDCQHL
jgi:hypothetical protein